MAAPSAPKGITELKVTYTMTAPDDSFVRSAKTKLPAYIWEKRGDGDPIIELKVLYDSEAPGDGFDAVRLSKPDQAEIVQLAYKKGTGSSPIIDVKVIADNEAALEGFTKIDRDINRDNSGQRSFVYFRTAEQLKKGRQFNVGDFVDVKDTIQKWCVGRVLEVDDEGQQVKVHYEGWSDKWDEWLKLNSKRIAMHLTYTKGGYTGPDQERAHKLDGDNLLAFRKTAQKFEEILDKKERTPEDVTFLQIDNVRMLQNILNAIIDDPTVVPEAATYLRLNLNLIVEQFASPKEIYNGFADSFVRLFFGDANCVKFYNKYGLDKTKNANKDGPFARMPAETIVDQFKELPTSVFLIENINYFGSLKGFEAIIERLTDKNRPTPFLFVRQVVKAIFSVKDFLVPGFLAQLVNAIREPVFDRMRKLSDDELKTLDRVSLSESVTHMQNLLFGVTRNLDHVAEAIEPLSLDIALRLLTCSVLEKRVNGIMELRDLIERVRRRAQPAASLMHGANARVEIARFLTADFLVKWMSSNELVELLLVRSPHSELLKRCAPILKFLAQHNSLSAEHLDLLWTSSIDKHESTVRVVYDAVADLANELPVSHLELLFNRVKQTPLEDYKDILLNFLKSFTISAVKRANNPSKKVFGLDIFWKLIQDNPNVAADVQKLAFDILVELLSPPSQLVEQCLLYMEKATINLRDCKSVPQSLRLAMKLLETYPSDGPRNYQQELILSIQDKLDVLSLIFNDFVKYSQTLRGEIKDAKDAKTDAKGDLDVTVAGSRFPHSEQLDIRLKFLDFILSRSPLLLNKDNITVLWKVFVVDSVHPEDKNKLYAWLTEVGGKRASSAFLPDVAEYIFSSLLCDHKQTSFDTLGKKGYDCFQTYLGYANNINGSLVHADDPRTRMVVAFSKLIGMGPLWNIVAFNLDPQVNYLSSSFLISLYVRLDDRNDKKVIYRDFLKNIHAFVLQACQGVSQKLNVEVNKRIIIQLIVLLQKFLFSIEQGDVDDENWDEYQAALKGQRKLVASLLDRDGHPDARVKSNVTLSVVPDSLILDVRNELARYIEHPAECLRLVYKKRVLYAEEYDHMTATDACIRSGSTITCYRMNKEDNLTRPVDDYNSETLYPRYLLANEKEYFDLLFDLLKIGGRVGQEVWKLLQRLPTNAQLATNINNLPAQIASQGVGAKPDWASLLDSTSLLRLFYSLKIVDRNLRSVPNDSESKQLDTSQWCEFFLQQDGFKHLYRVLLEMNLSQVFEDVLTQQCLSETLALCNYFLHGPFAEATKKACGSFIDYSKFIAHALGILKSAVEYDSSTDAAGQIVQAKLVEDSLQGVIGTISHHPELLEVVYTFPNLADVVFKGLNENKSQKVRAAFQAGLGRLCATFPSSPDMKSPRSILLPMLLAFLPKIDTESPNCNEYFDTIQTLLAAGKGQQDGVFDPTALSADLSKKIKQHPIIEARAMQVDAVLKGLLNLTRELVSQVPALKEPLGQEHGLVEELFTNCLFAQPTAQIRGVAPPPKCKSRDTRRAAFALLGELCKGSHSNFRELLTRLMPNHLITHSNGQAMKDFDFEPRTEEKSSTGYCGIKNLGCICYMNSLLQQLFMIPPLRRNILAIEEKYLEEDKKESVIFNLQYILAFLQESEKQYVNPKGFVHAFKDWEGNPTNIHIQMDSNEFFSMLMDRVDSKMKGTPHENAIKDVLGGVFSNQFIGKTTCEHFKERKEDFYAVSVNVKNKKTLEESLEAFVTGEMLEGDNAYMCSQCTKKVDTLKRTCLKTLPPTMIFHLKRFEFDMETMQKVKLNDHLAFPEKINLKPYTVEGLGGIKGKQNVTENTDGKSASDGKGEEMEMPDRPDSYYQYELAGIVVHTGSHDRGHYYSFIKERLTDEEKAQGKKSGWFEFNDTLVRPFDPADIADECFGGEEARTMTRSMWDTGMMGAMGMRHNVMGPLGPAGMGGMGQSAGNRETVMQEKYRNAYLLVYDRVEAYDIEMKEKRRREMDEKDMPAVSSPAMSPAPAPLASAPGSTAVTVPSKLKRRPSEIRVTVPSKIFNQIWDHNITYWRDKAIFDEEYFAFIWDIVNALVPEEDKSLSPPTPDDLGFLVTQLATRFIFETLFRAKNKRLLNEWWDVLRQLYATCTPACAWLLEHTAKDTSWSYHYLLACPKPELRSRAAELFTMALTIVSNQEEKLILQAASEPAPDLKDTSAKPLSPSFSVRYIDALLRLLKDAPEYWKIYGYYFQVFARFATQSRACAQYLGSRHVAGRFVDFFLGDLSPHPEVGDMLADNNGKRKSMRDDYTRPDMTGLFDAIRAIACSHLPPSNASTTPSTLISRASDTSNPVSLPQIDMKLLLCKPFLYYSMAYADNRKRGAYISQLISHLCWENEAVTNDVIGYIGAAMEELDADEIRPHFRILMALVKLEDPRHAQRVHEIMSSLLGIMQEQRKFWKITITCAEHIIRMAKKSPMVYQWMNQNFPKWEWVLEYVIGNPKPPMGPDASGIRMFKETRHAVHYNQDRGYQAYPGVSARDKQAAFECIKEGKALDPQGASDSDEDLSERVFTPGQWIDCKDSVQKWIWAQITQVQEDRVGVHFDGWSSKWDEWVPRNSNRMQLFLRFSNVPRTEPQKGAGPALGDDIGAGRLLTPDLYAQIQPLKKVPQPLHPEVMQKMYDEALLRRKQAESAPPSAPPAGGEAGAGGREGGEVDD